MAGILLAEPGRSIPTPGAHATSQLTKTMWIYIIGVLVLLGTFALVERYRRPRDPLSVDEPPPALPPAPPLDTGQLYTLVQHAIPVFNSASKADELLAHPVFQEGTRLLRESDADAAALLEYFTGDNPITAIMALEALTGRGREAWLSEQAVWVSTDEDDDSLSRVVASTVEETVLRYINTVHPWTRYFALRALRSCVPVERPLLGRLLLGADPSWTERTTMFHLKDFASARVADGEVPTLAGLEPPSAEQAGLVDYLLGELGDSLGANLLAEWQEMQSSHTDLGPLRQVGRVFDPDPEAEEPSVILHPALREHVDAALAALLQPRPSSLLVVGPTGVGKRSFLKALRAELCRRNWVVFEAGHGELMAGQVYVGSLEGRIKEILDQIGGKPRIAWFVEDFQNLLWGGRHSMSPLGILDLVIPYLEKGEITMVGETEASPYEQLLLEKPQIRSLFQSQRIEPLSGDETLQLAGEWAARHRLPDGRPLASPEVLREAWELADQYLRVQVAPGNTLHLLQLSHRRLQERDLDESRPLDLNDLIESMSSVSGLPASVLDDRQRLDLGELRRLFEGRVMGQEEAVACLVERLAMIKAGVSDPGRPLGVFLFAGPTGTGKTEIAKTLGEFLFGSAERVLRIDMSELQTPESLDRLLGEKGERTPSSLAHRIRQQPFSVILLDEFEKAQPNVWDIFLQVFDDGRLTDRQGNTADFRHSIIILTSNLGGVIPKGVSLGFGGTDGTFHPGTVERAISQSFRKEFLNRIDRVVVFRPLSVDTMKEILLREVEDVAQRRGLRSREWAVEWEEDALEFLLEKGFTPDLGARPLKRAVERYFLTPLALAIVNHAFPEGDQFLFVRRDGEELRVDFVDPDATPVSPVEGEEAAPVADGERIPLRRIVMEPKGTSAELERLRSVHDRLQALVESEAWQTSKRTGLEMTAAPGFWESPERFTILGDVEYLDRIERTLRQTGSLLERLEGAGKVRPRYARDLVQRVAQNLYLLESASGAVLKNLPRDAFLLVEGSRAWPQEEKGDTVAARLGRMYKAWAEARRMRYEVLEESAEGEHPYRFLLAVAGYAAYAILAPEQGLHVFEVPGARKGKLEKTQTRVRVVAQPEAPSGGERSQLAIARELLRASPSEAPPIVRRYREAPSPLVRDVGRGWRTGRLDRVLGGDFDLFHEVEEEGS